MMTILPWCWNCGQTRYRPALGKNCAAGDGLQVLGGSRRGHIVTGRVTPRSPGLLTVTPVLCSYLLPRARFLGHGDGVLVRLLKRAIGASSNGRSAARGSSSEAPECS